MPFWAMALIGQDKAMKLFAVNPESATVPRFTIH